MHNACTYRYVYDLHSAHARSDARLSISACTADGYNYRPTFDCIKFTYSLPDSLIITQWKQSTAYTTYFVDCYIVSVEAYDERSIAYICNGDCIHTSTLNHATPHSN